MTPGVLGLHSPLALALAILVGVVVPVMVIVEVIVVGAAYRHCALNNAPSANLERPR